MNGTRLLMVLLAAGGLMACGTDSGPADAEPAAPPPAPVEAPAVEAVSADETVVEGASERLARVLNAQPEEVRARYPQRRPAETLDFFGIEPGMTVVELLPGGGWYSRILAEYLGPEGTLIGANYAHGMWALFGFMSEERIAAMATWAADWPGQAAAWEVADAAAFEAFVIGELPEDKHGSADAVLMIRALHNLFRFDAEHGTLAPALADVYQVLKPGGIVGVVQHEARPDMPDDWADGANGYIKRDAVVAAFERAGFELVAESELNANPADLPGIEDSVWRLPPSLRVEDPERRAEMEAIGESHRMTLKFRKPAA